MGHKHEVRKCKEFFYMSPRVRWEKLEKGRMCFLCLKPRGICKLRSWVNHILVPKALKCAQCALWLESKSLAPLSIFFCKRKEHGDSRASPSEIKDALETYIGKLANRIVEANILVAVNFMFKVHSKVHYNKRVEKSRRLRTHSENFSSSSCDWF